MNVISEEFKNKLNNIFNVKIINKENIINSNNIVKKHTYEIDDFVDNVECNIIDNIVDKLFDIVCDDNNIILKIDNNVLNDIALSEDLSNINIDNDKKKLLSDCIITIINKALNNLTKDSTILFKSFMLCDSNIAILLYFLGILNDEDNNINKIMSITNRNANILSYAGKINDTLVYTTPLLSSIIILGLKDNIDDDSGLIYNLDNNMYIDNNNKNILNYYDSIVINNPEYFTSININ
jgi:hypothetical protein